MQNYCKIIIYKLKDKKGLMMKMLKYCPSDNSYQFQKYFQDNSLKNQVGFGYGVGDRSAIYIPYRRGGTIGRTIDLARGLIHLVTPIASELHSLIRPKKYQKYRVGI